MRHPLRSAFVFFILLIISTNFQRAEIHDQVPIPEFHKQPLLNGMEILFLPSSEPRLSFVLMIKNGAAFDPIEKWGVTHLTARLALEGTELRTGLELREDLQKMDAELDVHVTWDAIFFSGVAPADQLANVLTILAEMVVRPKFQEETFEALRQRLIREAGQEENHTESLTQNVFASRLFQGNPYEHSVRGSAKTLGNLQLADVKIQYRRLFMPNQTQLAVYYAGDREALFTALSRRWGSWVRGEALPFTFRPAPALTERRILVVDRPVEEPLLRWGRLGIEKGAKEYYPLKVFEHYLTLCLPQWASEVASHPQIRAQLQVEARKMPGYVQFSIQAGAERLISYLARFHGFLEELQQGKIDALRLEEARGLAFAEFKESFDVPLSRLHRLLEIDLYNLGINYITNYASRLNRVTPESLPATLRQVFSSPGYLIVVAGPAERLQPGLAQFGTVDVLSPALN